MSFALERSCGNSDSNSGCSKISSIFDTVAIIGLIAGGVFALYINQSLLGKSLLAGAGGMIVLDGLSLGCIRGVRAKKPKLSDDIRQERMFAKNAFPAYEAYSLRRFAVVPLQ